MTRKIMNNKSNYFDNRDHNKGNNGLSIPDSDRLAYSEARIGSLKLKMAIDKHYNYPGKISSS